MASKTKAVFPHHRRHYFEVLEKRYVLSVALDLSPNIMVEPVLEGNHPAYINVNHEASAFQSEMTIDVDPTNPMHLAGFAHRRDFNSSNYPAPPSVVGITDETRMDVFQSYDGGTTWITTTIKDQDENLGIGFASRRFDPSLTFNADGTLYIAYGHKVYGTPEKDTLIVARWDLDHFTFSVAASESNNEELDKWHLATGPDGLGHQAVYVAYTRVAPTAPYPSTYVMVTGSNDDSQEFQFEPPISVSEVVGDNIKHERLFADPAVGPSGELYISWMDVRYNSLSVPEFSKFYMDTDLDGIWQSAHDFGVDVVTIGGLEKDLYKTQVFAAPNNGIFAGPVLDIDRSVAHPGRLYLTWVDAVDKDTFGTTYDTNIFLAWSDNGGTDFANHVHIVSKPKGNGAWTDFLPWVDVDQVTGSVSVLYYTTEGDQNDGNDDVRVQLATSIDGGASFTRATMSSFTSNEIGGYGGDYLEYIGLAVHGGTAHALWASRMPVDQAHPYSIDLEILHASASFLSVEGDNVLTITGDDAGAHNDIIELTRPMTGPTANPNYLVVTVNGALQYAGLVASVNRIEIDGKNGDDQIFIDANLAVDVEIWGHAGNDAVTLRAAGESSLRSFAFHGNEGDDKLYVDYNTATGGDPLPLAGFEFKFDGGTGTDDGFVVEAGGAVRTAYFVDTLSDGSDTLMNGRADGNSAAADDQVTLRAAIQEANAAANKTYIFLPAGTNGLSIAGTGGAAQGDLDLTANVAIWAVARG